MINKSRKGTACYADRGSCRRVVGDCVLVVYRVLVLGPQRPHRARVLWSCLMSVVAQAEPQRRA